MFVSRSVEVERTAAAQRVVVDAVDKSARLSLTLDLELTASGLVRMRAAVRNYDEHLPYTVDALVVALPVPAEADELLDLAGGHIRDRTPQRAPFTVGCHQRNRLRPTTAAPRRGCPPSRWSSRAAPSVAWVSRSPTFTPSSCC